MFRLRVRQGEKGENIGYVGVTRAMRLWPRKGCRKQKNSFSGPHPWHIHGLTSSKVNAVEALCLGQKQSNSQFQEGRVTGGLLKPYLQLKGSLKHIKKSNAKSWASSLSRKMSLSLVSEKESSRKGLPQDQLWNYHCLIHNSKTSLILELLCFQWA